ncbi:hypothetical protein [Sphingomonas colocasiae]|uniref:Nuclear transport factor 2 family protein n=1 Tax=Sphingomonas colocasiae TaxID=1848973 RepID=A0ABS7PQF1_9SPHN|nr:hypothetical protein [Sphingomonas colocasiae]MBY8822945.1 hypothetical protein [Sphingomonas colocasiae]
MRKAIILLAALPLLAGASESNEQSNGYKLRTDNIVARLFYSALTDNAEQFQSALAPDAKFKGWDPVTDKYWSGPLVLPEVKKLTRMCVIDSYSTCPGLVTVNWRCAGEKGPRYSVVTLEGGKVAELSAFSPPAMCTPLPVEKSNG